MVKACLKNSSLFIRPLRARVPLKMFPGKTKKQFRKDLNKKSQVTTWPLDQPPLQLRRGGWPAAQVMAWLFVSEDVPV